MGNYRDSSISQRTHDNEIIKILTHVEERGAAAQRQRHPPVEENWSLFFKILKENRRAPEHHSTGLMGAIKT